jgi:hypothetical protein
MTGKCVLCATERLLANVGASVGTEFSAGRLMERGADVTGNAWSFGEQCLCFRDPDGLELALIEEATETGSSDQECRSVATARKQSICRSSMPILASTD